MEKLLMQEKGEDLLEAIDEYIFWLEKGIFRLHKIFFYPNRDPEVCSFLLAYEEELHCISEIKNPILRQKYYNKCFWEMVVDAIISYNKDKYIQN